MNRIIIIANGILYGNPYSRNSLKIFLDITETPMYPMLDEQMITIFGIIERRTTNG